MSIIVNLEIKTIVIVKGGGQSKEDFKYTHRGREIYEHYLTIV